MYPQRVRDQASAAMATGESLSSIARRLLVSRSTLPDWKAAPVPRMPRSQCPRCDDADLDVSAYSALLGYYQGDGCVSAHARCFMLRVSCDARLRRIIQDVTSLMERMRKGGEVFWVAAPGAVVVQSNWQHWPCLFPQH
jgi:hypothetical protein